MKIEKYKKIGFYYRTSKTNKIIWHGLRYSPYGYGIGYFYHNQDKGFWLIPQNLNYED